MNDSQVLGANRKGAQNELIQSEFLLITWLFQIDKPQVSLVCEFTDSRLSTS